MRNVDAIVEDLNALAVFLARRGVAAPERSDSDVVVVLGNSIVSSAEVAARAAKASGSWLICSGGIGHSTEDLRQAVRSIPRYAHLFVKDKSEAAILGGIARMCGVDPNRILLEEESTNTGENVLFSHRTLEAKGIHVRSILIVQDPTMQLRAHATFQKVYADTDVRLVSYAAFVPQVVAEGDEPRLDNPEVKGLWRFDRFVSLLLGEIPRLIEYGPSRRAFIAKIEVPQPVLEAHARLQKVFPDLSNR